jgi:CubicO group peptidase (beta-lactamase class C family)
MAAALATFGPLMLATPSLAASLDDELRAIVNDPQKPLASLSVLAIRDGRIVYERQFGHRWIDRVDPAKSRPANPSTLYRIASITKLVTALGVMRLVEAGKLDLDTDIGRYLGYEVRNPHFPRVPITLRELLAHTSSLRDDADYVFPPGHDMRDFLVPGGKRYGTGAMWSSKAAPGEYFAYCNLNSGVVATIMEKVSGERFDRLMQRLVLDTLGMHGGFNPAEMRAERVADIATIYRKATAGDRQVWNPGGAWIAQVDDYSSRAPVNRASPDYILGSNGALFGPQGNLRASVADLARVMLMLMNRGTVDGKRFLEERSVDALLARNWKYMGTNGESSYGDAKQLFNAWGLGNQQFVDVSGPGFGDRLVEGGGFTGMGHIGDAYGLHGLFVFDPRTRSGIVYLAGGTGFDPDTDRGQYSGFHRYEERILTAVYRHAIEGRP